MKIDPVAIYVAVVPRTPADLAFSLGLAEAVTPSVEAHGAARRTLGASWRTSLDLLRGTR